MRVLISCSIFFWIVMFSSGKAAAEVQSAQPGTIEIYSAGKKYYSISAYQQYQLRQGAGPLGAWGDQVSSSAALQEIKQGKNVFIQQDGLRESVLNASKAEDRYQIERMFQEYKQSKDVGEDIPLDFSKMKTVTVKPARTYVIPKPMADRKEAVAGKMLSKNNELARSMRIQKLKDALGQDGARACLTKSNYPVKTLQGYPSFAFKTDKVGFNRFKSVLKQTTVFKRVQSIRMYRDQSLSEMIADGKLPPVHIDREAHLQKHTLRDVSSN